jgi:hypothetical protein
MIEQERNETNIANIGQIATFTLFDLGRLIWEVDKPSGSTCRKCLFNFDIKMLILT